MSILQIRDAQMRAMREVTTLHALEGGLQKLFSEQCEALGPRVLQEIAEDSIVKACAFGFEPAHYLGFAALQMVFGQSFWEQEEHAWAKSILEDPFLWTSAHRMQELRQASVKYLASLAEQEEQPAEV
ncbi:MAG: hypothetical protein JST65_01395 [Acidobacteria bacterium]|nr:hypothetical protein [Acidobacteriota bacterium]